MLVVPAVRNASSQDADADAKALEAVLRAVVKSISVYCTTNDKEHEFEMLYISAACLQFPKLLHIHFTEGPHRLL
jgi:hypothetical protein